MEHPKLARSHHDILDVIVRRWSPRAFDPAREVAMSDLLRLFEAARWAPSSRNEQPWRFVIADRRRQPATFAAVQSSLRGANPQWAHAAPVLVLVACRLTHERDEATNLHAWYDTGQAVGFLTLQATSIGLSVRQMEGFDRAIVRDVLHVPAAFEPAVLMAIGYSGDPDALASDKHRAAERTPRARRPLEEIVFDGEWGKMLA
jgi:nitroreductase